ncbi:glycosyltransferase family 39 protein [Candidatus Woesearchaeota archaeon]|nr:glycosyltransferase family 39 protein [Candidatus Woesearchaeota archaeon]
MKFNNKYLLFSFLFFLLFLFSYFISLQGLLAWDEVVYLANARSYIGDSFFVEDFRFPLLSAVIGGVWLLTGEFVIVAQLLMILFSLGSVLVFYFVAKYFLSDDLSLLASLIFGFSLQFITWGFRIYTDILGVLLFLLAFLFFLKHEEIKNKFVTKGYFFVFLAGLFSGLAFSARLSTIIVSFVLVIFFLLRKNWFRNLLFYGSGFLLAIIPWLIHGLIKKGHPLYFALSQTSAILEYTARESPLILLRFLLAEYGLALLLILFNVLYFFKFWKRGFNKKFYSKTSLLLLVLSSQLLFYFFFVKLKLARYILEMSPFIVLLIVLGFNVVLLLTNNKYKDLMFVFLLIVLFVSIFLTSIHGINDLIKTSKCTSSGALHQSISLIKEISEPGQLIVSSVWPYFGYYANLEAYSPWSVNMSDYFMSYDPDFFAFSEQAGIPFLGVVNHSQVHELFYISDSCGWDLTVYEVRD